MHILNECGVPIVRESQDKCKVDKYGKRLLELCRSLELFFVNGRVGNDKGIGLTTCNNSVIDYAIVSPTLFRSIVLIFDPKPIYLKLCSNLSDVNNSNVYDIDNATNNQGELIVKPRWASDRGPVFTEHLDDACIDELLNGLEDIDPQNTNTVLYNIL